MAQQRAKTVGELPEVIKTSFGELAEGFTMLIWGQSGHGKSHLTTELVKVMGAAMGKGLYLSLEEGFEVTLQRRVLAHLDPEAHKGYVEFADHRMTVAELDARLRKKRRPKWVVVDSLQYWDITYPTYKRLKEQHPGVAFVFISHAKGKKPDGKTAEKIRYDAGVKVYVDGFVASVASRYGGNKPYVIWEEGAKKHWGRKLKKMLS